MNYCHFVHAASTQPIIPSIHQCRSHPVVQSRPRQIHSSLLQLLPIPATQAHFSSILISFSFPIPFLSSLHPQMRHHHLPRNYQFPPSFDHFHLQNVSHFVPFSPPTFLVLLQSNTQCHTFHQTIQHSIFVSNTF